MVGTSCCRCCRAHAQVVVVMMVGCSRCDPAAKMKARSYPNIAVCQSLDITIRTGTTTIVTSKRTAPWLVTLTPPNKSAGAARAAARDTTADRCVRPASQQAGMAAAQPNVQQQQWE